MAVSKSTQRLGVSVPGPLGGIEGSAVCFRTEDAVSLVYFFGVVLRSNKARHRQHDETAVAATNREISLMSSPYCRAIKMQPDVKNRAHRRCRS
jgi:hypothetical protein